MATFFCADGPGGADVAGLGGGGVVFALAVGGANGVDGGHIEDVEAHGGDSGEAGSYVVEGAVCAGLFSVGCRRAGGAGEEFVPGGEAGAFAVGPDGELGEVFGGEGEVGVLRHEGHEGGGDGVFVEGEVLVGERAKFDGGGGELPGVGGPGADGGDFQVVGANAEGEGYVLGAGFLSGKTLHEVGGPGVEVVDPGFDGEEVMTDLVEGEGGGPEVIRQGSEGGGLPLLGGGVTVAETGGDVVVAVREDGGGDGDGVADDALDGVAAVVDGGLDLFDDDAAAAFVGFHARCWLLEDV